MTTPDTEKVPGPPDNTHNRLFEALCGLGRKAGGLDFWLRPAGTHRAAGAAIIWGTCGPHRQDRRSPRTLKRYLGLWPMHRTGFIGPLPASLQSRGLDFWTGHTERWELSPHRDTAVPTAWTEAHPRHSQVPGPPVSTQGRGCGALPGLGRKARTSMAGSL